MSVPTYVVDAGLGQAWLALDTPDHDPRKATRGSADNAEFGSAKERSEPEPYIKRLARYHAQACIRYARQKRGATAEKSPAVRRKPPQIAADGKAIHDPTRDTAQRIVTWLRANGPATAEQVSAALGITPHAAQYHLKPAYRSHEIEIVSRIGLAYVYGVAGQIAPPPQRAPIGKHGALRNRIVDYIEGYGPATVAEIADALGATNYAVIGHLKESRRPEGIGIVGYERHHKRDAPIYGVMIDDE